MRSENEYIVEINDHIIEKLGVVEEIRKVSIGILSIIKDRIPIKNRPTQYLYDTNSTQNKYKIKYSEFNVETYILGILISFDVKNFDFESKAKREQYIEENGVESLITLSHIYSSANPSQNNITLYVPTANKSVMNDELYKQIQSAIRKCYNGYKKSLHYEYDGNYEIVKDYLTNGNDVERAVATTLYYSKKDTLTNLRKNLKKSVFDGRKFGDLLDYNVITQSDIFKSLKELDSKNKIINSRNRYNISSYLWTWGFDTVSYLGIKKLNSDIHTWLIDIIADICFLANYDFIMDPKVPLFSAWSGDPTWSFLIPKV